MTLRLASRPLLTLVLLLHLLAAPAAAQPSGTMTWGVHVTLATRWLDTSETESDITPFMILYALQRRAGQADARQSQFAVSGRVVDHVQGRAHLGVRPAQGRPVSTTEIP